MERQHLRHDFAVQGAVVLPIGLHVPVDVVLFLVELVAREGRKRFLRIQVFPLARRFLDGHAARQAFEQQLAQRLGSAEDGRARHEFGHGGPVCGVPVAHRSPQALDGQVVALLADPAKPVRRAPLQIVMGSPSPKVGEGIVGGVQGQRAEVGGIRGGVAEFDGREVFRKHVDPQKRHVIHPWADFDELDTHHYPAYLTGVARFTNGYKVFMPAEFMHGQYDQGHGAGLEDFWARYTAHPLFAGGFMWAYSDEAVRRSDRGGALDSEDYNAPDGILGPFREKEGSYYSVREVWSPIHIEPLMITPSFRGDFRVSNRYLFTNLGACSMCWRVLHCTSPLNGDGEGEVVTVADGGARAWRQVLDSGMVQLPSLVPGETGFARMNLPDNFFNGDILELEAYGADGESVCTRTFPIHYAKDYLKGELQPKRADAHPSGSQSAAASNCRVEETDTLITLRSSAVTVSFRKSDATITSVTRNADGRIIPLKDGPVAVGMKMVLADLSARTENGDAVLCARYRGAADSIVWRLAPDGLLSMDAVLLNRASGGGGFDDAFTDTEVLNLGLTFSYPESECSGMRWMGRGPYRVWKNRIPGANYGVWQKDYNNTITGESTERLVYPEFKGYHANLYWATLQSSTAPFTVYAASDGIFLRVFTPEEPHGRQDGLNTMPDFPAGDISFLLDIPAIRCFKPISQHGPQSQPGIIRIKKGDEGLRLNLMFDFR